MCNALAVAYPNFAASVPFYDRQRNTADLPMIQAPLLVQYGEKDARAGWPAYEEALKAAGTPRERIFKRANHGFHNSSTSRYDDVQPL